METALLVGIAGIALVVAVTTLAPRVGVAAPLLLVVLGIGISYLPFVEAIEIEPEWILGGILPPLLYAAAVNVPAMEFRRDFRLISAYSVVLVVVSALGVGFLMTWLIPGLPLPLGIALGAIVSPTDAVATSIVQRAGVSTRMVTVLKGESLLNDASALVLLKSAVAATAASVSLVQVGLNFVYSVVLAVAIGFAVGRLNLLLRSRIAMTSANVAISLIMPFVAYLPAEHLGASGLVATVTAGLVTGIGSAKVLSAETRLASDAVWSTIELVLESTIFLIMGLELFALVEDLLDVHGSLGLALGLGAIAATAVIAVRVVFIAASLWLLSRRSRRAPEGRERLEAIQERLAGAPPEFAATPRMGRMQRLLDRRLADLDYLADEHFGPKEGVVLVWAGMRGAITLAAAQSLPLGTPQRSLLILIAFVVAAGTLIIQGGTLLPLARWLGLTARNANEDLEQRFILKTELAAAAHARLDDPDLTRADGTPYSPEVVEKVRKGLIAAALDPNTLDDEVLGRRADALALRLDLIDAQRRALLDLRDRGTYPTVLLDDQLQRLDADQLGLQLRRLG